MKSKKKILKDKNIVCDISIANVDVLQKVFFNNFFGLNIFLYLYSCIFKKFLQTSDQLITRACCDYLVVIQPKKEQLSRSTDRKREILKLSRHI